MLWKWYLPLLWSRKLQTGTASFFFFLFTPGWGIEGLKSSAINTNNRGREQTWKAARRRAISTAPGPAFKSPSAAMQTDMVKRVWHKPQSQTGLIHGAWQQATSSGATAASRPFSPGGGGGSAALWWMVDGPPLCHFSSFIPALPQNPERGFKTTRLGWLMNGASAWWQTDTIITVNLSPAAVPPNSVPPHKPARQYSFPLISASHFRLSSSQTPQTHLCSSLSCNQARTTMQWWLITERGHSSPCFKALAGRAGGAQRSTLKSCRSMGCMFVGNA